MGAHAENILSLFSRRRTRLTSSVTKRRLTEQAKSDVEESIDVIEDYQKRINELQREQSTALEEAKTRLSEIANDVIEIPMTAYRKDVLLDLFGIAWMPYYLVQIGETIENCRVIHLISIILKKTEFIITGK